MQSYTLTALKEKLGSIFSDVSRRGKTVFITRYNKTSAVILPFKEYKKLQQGSRALIDYTSLQTVQQVVRFLKARYPGKNIVLNKDAQGEVAEVICEVYNGSDFSKAIAVIIKGSLLHYHKTLTETYFVKHGKLRVWKDNKEYIISEGETITFKPYEQHKTVGHFVWLEVYSHPGWKFSDHILVDSSD